VRFVNASASTATGTWDDAPRSNIQLGCAGLRRVLINLRLLAIADCRKTTALRRLGYEQFSWSKEAIVP
jgi:hypothetical protein